MAEDLPEVVARADFLSCEAVGLAQGIEEITGRRKGQMGDEAREAVTGRSLWVNPRTLNFLLKAAGPGEGF